MTFKVLKRKIVNTYKRLNENEKMHIKIAKRNAKRLRNKDFSLIARNCVGGVMCHDVGVEFKSPTINLWIPNKDYIVFLKDLKSYLTADMTFLRDDEKDVPYPVGVLFSGREEVRIYFMHYKTNEDALEKWRERASRVNFDNLFVLFQDLDGCEYEDLVEFDKLPYKNKVALVHKEYPEIKSAFVIKGLTGDHPGEMLDYIKDYSGKKFYDQFPYVDWFNGKNIFK